MTTLPVLVADNDGVVHWRDMSGSGADDHDWYQVGTTDPPTDINQNMYTFGRAGVNTDNPSAQLHVVRTNATLPFVFFGDKAGRFEAGGTGFVNIAGEFLASNNTSNTAANVAGAFAAGSNDFEAENFGIFTTSGSGTLDYAIWAEVPGSAADGDFAGFFVGDVVVTGDINPPSDQKLKENVEDIDNALYLINQLQPRTFTFNRNDYSFMNLSDGLQYGLIAQEVESVLPELVSRNTHPAKYDSTGNEIRAAVEYKGLNYESFIPILIQGVKEQQAFIDSQEQRISDLEARLSAIESMLAGGGNAMKQGGTTEEETLGHNTGIQQYSNKTILNQNNPNPFSRETDISYTIPQSGKVDIEVYTLTGQLVTKLVSQSQDSGTHTVTWDAADVPAGVYFYVLKVNGEELTKKAIKLK